MRHYDIFQAECINRSQDLEFFRINLPSAINFLEIEDLMHVESLRLVILHNEVWGLRRSPRGMTCLMHGQYGRNYGIVHPWSFPTKGQPGLRAADYEFNAISCTSTLK
jgi:hypothetical protein